MFCTNCGKKNADHANFCEDCGKRLVKPIPVVPVAEAEAPVAPEPPVAIPEVPVTQETVIVPQIPEEPAAEKMEDQATIVVPQIPAKPEQDPLEKLYPAPEKKKKNKIGLIIGLLVGLGAATVLLISIIVVVILGIASNWWRTPTPDKQPDTPSSVVPTQPVDVPVEEDLSADELRQKLTCYYAGGLNIYLNGNFDRADGVNNAAFLDDDLQVEVFWGPVEKGVDSSREFAKSYEDEMESEFDELQRLKANGIYYTVGTDGDEVTVVGFYVYNGYGWVVQIITDDYEARGEELINYVTLGQVAEGFEPPVSGDGTAVPAEFSFSGLTLTLDDSFRTTSYDQYCVYQNDNMTFIVQYYPLESFGVQSSKEYAQQYLESSQEEGWAQLYMETSDGQFYYVAMASDEDWVSLIGLYTYGDAAWLVMAETVDGKGYSETMLNYFTSGQVVPNQVPQILPEKTVEYEGLKLTVTTDYKESYRGADYLYLTNGAVEVTVSCDQANGAATALEMAEQDYLRFQGAWENMYIEELGYMVYLIAYDTNENAVNIVQGYYVAGKQCWVIGVQSVGTSKMSEMVQIATSGITPENVFEHGEPVVRDRITMTRQSTAQYSGLQFSYSPDWQLDTTWGGTSDYVGDGITMSVGQDSLEFRGASNALEVAWLEAEDGSTSWGHYEVGLADGIPYVILWDESADFYVVMGIYADSVYCWEIWVTYTDTELLDQAIWYATSGVIL